jgi:hypothetical protein
MKNERKICITNQWGSPIIGRFLHKPKDGELDNSELGML